MLGYFLIKHPDVYDTIMDYIDQHRAIVADYNKSVPLEDIGARLLRPDDQVIGGTAETYTADYSDGADEDLLVTGVGAQRVPIGMGVLHLGWWCELDLGPNGILEVDLEGIKRQELIARIVFQMDMHMYIEPLQIVFAKENDLINWIVRNESGVDYTNVGDIFPFAFLIGPRKQLLI